MLREIACLCAFHYCLLTSIGLLYLPWNPLNEQRHVLELIKNICMLGASLLVN